jgi:hypothetical protein
VTARRTFLHDLLLDLNLGDLRGLLGSHCRLERDTTNQKDSKNLHKL